MKKISKLLFWLILLVSAQSISAQNYKEYAQKVRQEVWAWQRPEFDKHTVPAEYAKESAVIIACHNQILASGKSKIRFDVNTIFGVNRELYYTDIYRAKVKLNDKKALEKFSTISFKEQDKRGGYRVSNKLTTIIGARIIKPDNSIIEVNLDESVAVTEGKNDKEEYRKLAIPGLQEGDILDYFIQEEMRIDDANIPIQNLWFAGRYPMLSYSVHCEVSKNLTVEYRSLNGAPQFVQTESDDDYILDAELKNVAKVPNTIWVSPLRSIPVIRLAILYNKSKVIYKPATARKSGVYSSLSPETIISDAFACLNDRSEYYFTRTEPRFTKEIKRFQKENPNASKEELADYIYQVVSFMRGTSGYARSSYDFAIVLKRYFDLFKIPHKVGMVPNKYGPKRECLTHYFDLEPVVYANGDRQIYFNPQPVGIAGELVQDYEGEVATLISIKKLKKGYKGLDGSQTLATIPSTSSVQNERFTSVRAEISPDNPLELIIDRKVDASGYMKEIYHHYILLYEDLDKSKRDYLGMKESFFDELSKSRQGRKYMDEWKTQFAKERESVKDSVKSEIRYYHDEDAKNLLNYSFDELGVTPQSPKTKYSCKYTMEGLVKRAGLNLIVDVGKLIGSQLKLDSDDRKRSIDVYMPNARSLVTEISFTIPDGYRVDNLSQFNKSVSNSCGEFVSVAHLEGQQLRIDVSKVFRHNFETADKWSQLESIIDSANEFFALSLVLRKE